MATKGGKVTNLEERKCGDDKKMNINVVILRNRRTVTLLHDDKRYSR